MRRRFGKTASLSAIGIFIMINVCLGHTLAWGADDVEQLKKVGAQYFRKGNFKEALSVYERARDIICSDEDNVECAQMKGVVEAVAECLEKGRFTPRIARIVFGPRVVYKGASKGVSKGPASIVRDVFHGTLPVLFVVGTTDFLDMDEARDQIQIYADEIRKSQAAYVTKGHASDDGGWDFNWRLSEKRAKKVMEILVTEHGISRNQMSCKWFGEDPRYFETQIDGLQGKALEAARRENRRVEVSLSTE